MQKHTVDVPGAEEFASRPKSRRDFFKTLAAASAGAAGGSLLLSRKASAQDYSSASASASASASSSASASAGASGDVDIFNFALTLEYLEAEFYGLALDAGVLSGDALAVVEATYDHEVQHVDAIIAALEERGATPVAKPEFVFPEDAFTSQAGILDLAVTFEPVGVGAYLGAAPLIQEGELLAAAGSIAGVEGEHVVAFNNLVTGLPAAVEAFPAALTMDEVLAAVSPFIMGGMMETGGGSEYRDRNSFGRV